MHQPIGLYTFILKSDEKCLMVTTKSVKVLQEKEFYDMFTFLLYIKYFTYTWGFFPVLRLAWNYVQGLIQYHKEDKYHHQPKALLRVENDRNLIQTDC